MKPVSVKELAALLDKAIKEGKGDCAVLVSDDEECNGYHELWWKGTYEQGNDTQYLGDDNRWHYMNTITISQYKNGKGTIFEIFSPKYLVI